MEAVVISRTFLKPMYRLAFVIGISISAHAIQAQSIPGIYGGGPPSELGTFRYIQLQGASGSTYTLPLNGILNYVAYYIPASGAFIPGGEYSLYYLNSAEKVVGTAGTVTYSPNSEYTNGIEVSAPNPGAPGALGIQGTFTVGGYDFQGASVRLVSGSNSTVATATTNGNGFFSLYYGNSPATDSGFIAPGSYTVEINYIFREPPHCEESYSANIPVTYAPSNTSNPALASYYVTNAAVNLGTIVATIKGQGTCN
jgi:hypothetical protein